MTQEALAERAGMSVRGIGDLERGLRLPRRDTVRLLLDALELSPEERSRLEAAARMRPFGGAETVTPAETGAFLGSLPPIRLVARRREVDRLLAATDSVVGGQGRFLILTGEPGIGKTRVAQEAALAAAQRGFLVATGRCYETERDVPFHPFVEALTVAYPLLPRTIRDDIPVRWPYLAALLPEDTLPQPAAQSAQARGLEGQQRLFRSVSSLLSMVAEERPVALLLDDLHWTDEATLKLLLHLARHTRNSRVLLLGTYRDVDVDARHPLDRALVDLNRERLVERIVLNHLEPDGTSEVIAETLGNEVDDLPGLTATVHRVTSGNPFFIQEVLHMLVEDGNLYQENGRWYRGDIRQIPPPETVRAAIQQRLTRLPDVTEAVLHEASVLGQTFGFDDLLVLSRRDEDEIDDALQAAAGVGLIREAGQGLYTFNHVLTQQALYTDLSQRRRQRLHLAAGEALVRLPEPARARRAAELARHFRAGGDIEQAVIYSMLAGDRAEGLFAYEDAERHFHTAVALTSGTTWESDDRSVPARALARLGRVLHIGEKYDEALEILERAADSYRALGDRDNEVMLVAEIGWLHHSRRTDEQGIERIEPLISSLSAGPDSIQRDWGLASLNTAKARLLFGLRRYGDELEAAECACDAAARIGDTEVQAVAEARRGAALMTLGRREEAQTSLNRAIALAEANGNLGTMSVALDNLGEMAAERGDFLQARSNFERAVEVAEQTGLPGRMGWTLVKLGRILLLLGEWPQARTVLERALQLLEEDDRAALYPATFLAHLGAWTGRSRRAAGDLEEAAAAATRYGDLWLRRHTSHILAHLDVLAGRPAAARDRLAPLLKGEGRDEPQAILLFAPLAWACIGLNRLGEAERLLAEGLERATQHGHEVAGADQMGVLAILRRRQGRLDEAQAALAEAIERVERMPDPYRLALAHTGMSLLARERGDGAASAEHRERALAIAENLGAGPLTDYIEGLSDGRAGPRT